MKSLSSTQREKIRKQMVKIATLQLTDKLHLKLGFCHFNKNTKKLGKILRAYSNNKDAPL